MAKEINVGNVGYDDCSFFYEARGGCQTDLQISAEFSGSYGNIHTCCGSQHILCPLNKYGGILVIAPRKED